MNPRRILILQGHPDPAGGHLCHALADAYATAAQDADHLVRRVEMARLHVPLLRSQAEWEHGALPAQLQPAQDDIAWAEHLVFVFPLWMGDMPALVKAFLEQVARPGFAFERGTIGPNGQKKLRGRSARIVVTMGMPALVYRYVFRAHSVKALERNVLGFVGIGPIHETLIGQVDSQDDQARAVWLGRLRRMGARGT